MSQSDGKGRRGFDIKSLMQRFEPGADASDQQRAKNPFARASPSASNATTGKGNPFAATKSPSKTTDGQPNQPPASSKPAPPKKPNDLRLSPQMRRSAMANKAKRASRAGDGSRPSASGALGRSPSTSTPSKPCSAPAASPAPVPAHVSPSKPAPPSKPDGLLKRLSRASLESVEPVPKQQQSAPQQQRQANGKSAVSNGTVTALAASATTADSTSTVEPAAGKLDGGGGLAPSPQQQAEQKRLGSKPLPLPSPKSLRKAQERAGGVSRTPVKAGSDNSEDGAGVAATTGTEPAGAPTPSPAAAPTPSPAAPTPSPVSAPHHHTSAQGTVAAAVAAASGGIPAPLSPPPKRKSVTRSSPKQSAAGSASNPYVNIHVSPTSGAHVLDSSPPQETTTAIASNDGSCSGGSSPSKSPGTSRVAAAKMLFLRQQNVGGESSSDVPRKTAAPKQRLVLQHDSPGDSSTDDAPPQATPNAVSHSSKPEAKAEAAAGPESAGEPEPAPEPQAEPATPAEPATSAEPATPAEPKVEPQEPPVAVVAAPADDSTLVVAKFDYSQRDDDELSFKKGDLIRVASQNDDEWWQGVLNGKLGHFPRLYVAAIPASETETDGDEIYANCDVAAPAPPAAAVVPEPVSESIYGNVDIPPPEPGPQAQAVIIPVADPGIYANVDIPPADASTTHTEEQPLAVEKPGEETNKVEGDDETNTEAAMAAATDADAGNSGDDEQDVVYGEALFDYDATSDKELTFRKSDVIEIFSYGDSEAWWCGAIDDRDGWFPSSYVKLLPADSPVLRAMATAALRASQYDESDREDDDDERRDSAPPPGSEASKQERLRERVYKEIVKTEKDYIADLEMMIRGYMMPMRRAVGQLFDDTSIEFIFSNIEQLHHLHVNFFTSLEATGVTGCGECIARNSENMRIYSVYCSNHPRAAVELDRLLDHDFQMETFFEGCRLLVEKEFSLQGFLLKPVQRICQYPLMLKELLKHTPEGHPDHENVERALDITKEIASTINEEKRNREEIVRLQASLENWEGPDILDISTKLIHEGTLTKISNGKAQERHFFLFDNLFVYCKRSLSGKLEVKGKISTDSFTVIDLQDGEVRHGKTPVRNAFRINNSEKNKWYVLYAKTPEEKQEWVGQFMAERNLVSRLIMAGMGMRAAAFRQDQRLSMKGRRDKLKTYGAKTLRTAKRRPSTRPSHPRK